jgi:hypothetical protein
MSNICVLATPAGSGGVSGGNDGAVADTSVTTSTGGNGGATIPSNVGTGGATIPPAGTGGATIPPAATGGATIPPAGTGGATIPSAGTGGATIPPTGTGGATIPPAGTGGATIPPAGVDGGTVSTGGIGGTTSPPGGTGGTSTGGVVGTNLVKNGDFSQGKLYWDLTLQAGDVGAQSYSGGQYCVYNESSAAYLSFSLGYPSSPSDAFAVDAGASYTFSYQVTGWGSIEAKVGGAVTPYTAVTSFTDSASSSSTVQTITHIITPTTSVAQTGLVFNGTLYYLDSVCFDNITFVKN